MEEIPWWMKFITISPQGYTAWDESQANQLGTFKTVREAEIALKRHAAELNKTRED